MTFLRARTQAQIEQRQLDIIQACDTLFMQGGYDNVNMKAISEITTLTRSSLYTYYKTKDEIILDLLLEELLIWKESLLDWTKKTAPLSKAKFCMEFTNILLQNDKMLQHYSLLYSFLEKNSRLEKLILFKQEAVPVMMTLVQIIQTNFPEYSAKQAYTIAEKIVFYVLGLYPATHLTPKQKEALVQSQTGYYEPDFTALCASGIQAFLI